MQCNISKKSFKEAISRQKDKCTLCGDKLGPLRDFSTCIGFYKGEGPSKIAELVHRWCFRQIRDRVMRKSPFKLDPNGPNGWMLDLSGLSARASKKYTTKWRIITSLISENNGLFCGICGGWIEFPEDFSIDHVIPKSAGYSLIMNFQVSHTWCNNNKGATITHPPVKIHCAYCTSEFVTYDSSPWATKRMCRVCVSKKRQGWLKPTECDHKSIVSAIDRYNNMIWECSTCHRISSSLVFENVIDIDEVWDVCYPTEIAR